MSAKVLRPNSRLYLMRRRAALWAPGTSAERYRASILDSTNRVGIVLQLQGTSKWRRILPGY